MIPDPEDYTDTFTISKMEVVDGKKVRARAGGSGVTVGTGVDYLFKRAVNTKRILSEAERLFRWNVSEQNGYGAWSI